MSQFDAGKAVFKIVAESADAQAKIEAARKGMKDLKDAGGPGGGLNGLNEAAESIEAAIGAARGAALVAIPVEIARKVVEIAKAWDEATAAIVRFQTAEIKAQQESSAHAGEQVRPRFTEASERFRAIRKEMADAATKADEEYNKKIGELNSRSSAQIQIDSLVDGFEDQAAVTAKYESEKKRRAAEDARNLTTLQKELAKDSGEQVEAAQAAAMEGIERAAAAERLRHKHSQRLIDNMGDDGPVNAALKNQANAEEEARQKAAYTQIGRATRSLQLEAYEAEQAASREKMEGEVKIRQEEADRVASIRARALLKRGTEEGRALTREAAAAERAATDAQTIRERNEVERQKLGGLQAQMGLAKSPEERRIIALHILDMEHERITRGMTEREKAAADEKYGYEKQLLDRQTANEIESVRARLRSLAEGIHDSALSGFGLRDSVNPAIGADQQAEIIGTLAPILRMTGGH